MMMKYSLTYLFLLYEIDWESGFHLDQVLLNQIVCENMRREDARIPSIWD